MSSSSDSRAPRRESRRPNAAALSKSSPGPRKPSPTRREIGSRYEQEAAEFMIQHGYTILERNWQAGHKEIDLIAAKPGVIVFVEVKAARSTAMGHPAEWISSKKMTLLAQAAQTYIDQKNIAGCDIRFDVICFVKDRLEYYPAAFDAPE